MKGVDRILKIRYERIKRGWSLAYVGKMIGLTKQSVYDIETSKNKPSYNVLVKIEELYGTPHNILFSQIDQSIDEISIAKNNNK